MHNTANRIMSITTATPDATADEISTRGVLAELVLLDTFDQLRTAAGHDYGNGQRGSELMRRRNAARELGLPYMPSLDDVSGDELMAAYQRVGEPRLKRAERENYRRNTPGTVRTVGAWEKVRRIVNAKVTN